MNRVAEEIRSYYGVSDEPKALTHYGMPRRSGRYPWGSGDNPYQRSGDWLSRVEKMQKDGMSKKDIMDELNLSSTEFRLLEARAKHMRKQYEYEHIKSLKSDGYSTAEIARMTGKNESSIRSILDDKNKELKLYKADRTADILRKELETKQAIDIGKGVELGLGVSPSTLEEAVLILEMEGYGHYGVGVKNPTDPRGYQTNTDVLVRPGVEYHELYDNPEMIREVGEFHSTDSGSTWSKREYPASIDSDRVYIKYGDQGGEQKDGVIEIRPGVADLNLGNSHYAQVRIMVDGTHYLKGMAIYSDDIPEGKDIVFNTNKESGTPKEKVFKKISDDPEDPFGAYIKADGQSKYIGADGKEHLSAINKLKEEGDYETQSRTLSSQFLSKQPLPLIKSQLDISYKDYDAQFKEIESLTNPALKQKMLMDFGDECDSAAQHMKAVAFPRQKQQVILPVPQMKDNEVYAPNWNNGETVALVRYPHGGIFEIPILTVNNNNPAARKYLGDAADAIGINKTVADQLSGADFDGDTVTVIPLSDRVRINAAKPLDGLKGFDPKTEYFVPEEKRQSKENPKGIPMMSKAYTQKQMGQVSNLITDMTLQGASMDEIERAVKHSMVVIDANKHNLNYKKSELDNDIQSLRVLYQPKVDENGNLVLDKNGNPKAGGAKTLISRRKQTIDVPERKGSAQIDPKTGEISWHETKRTYVDPKTGEVRRAMDKASLIKETKDLRTLSSGTTQENLYADYGNQLKDLANRARAEAKNTPNMQYNPDAKIAYGREVADLNEKVKAARENKPKERRALTLALGRINARIQGYPELRLDENAKLLRKIKQTELENARAEVGAKGKAVQIHLTDKEWEAIQAGAVSHSKAKEIFQYCDQDELRQRALPKSSTVLSSAKIGKIQSLAASGNYTRAEIADLMGVSVSTVSSYLAA